MSKGLAASRAAVPIQQTWQSHELKLAARGGVEPPRLFLDTPDFSGIRFLRN